MHIIRSVPLGESPRRIAHQETSQTFGIVTMRVDMMSALGLQPTRSSASTLVLSKTFSAGHLFKDGAPPTLSIGEEAEVHNLLVVDKHSFEVLHCHQFTPCEYVLSIVSAMLGDDPKTYYIVGTALVNPKESEPRVGRIIVFLFEDQKVKQISEREIKGACYCLIEFNGKLLAAINSTVRLFEWTAEKELRLVSSHFNNIKALYLKSKGDFIIVGDLMRSMALLHFKTMEGTLEEVIHPLKIVLLIKLCKTSTFKDGSRFPPYLDECCGNH
jgi:DNA damage-binding protein 1